jgi:hypothetical protein
VPNPASPDSEIAHVKARRTSRRSVLAQATSAALIGSAIGWIGRAPEALAAPGQEIVGTWAAVNSALGTRIAMYDADGGAMAVQADPTRTTQVGTWVRTGDLQFLLRTLSIRMDGQGNAIGTVDFRLSLTVDSSGESYSGQAVQRELDLNGGQASSSNATVQATRVRTMPI